MSTSSETSAVFDAALALPPETREALIRELILSVDRDQPKDPEYDRLWAAEIERRWAAYERGEMDTIDWREALDQIRQSLHQRRTA